MTDRQGWHICLHLADVVSCFFCNLVGKYTTPMNFVLYDLFEGWSVVGLSKSRQKGCSRELIR